MPKHPLASSSALPFAAFVLAAPLAAAPARADAPDREAEAIAELEKRVRRAAEDPDALIEAIDGLAPFDSTRVAQAVHAAAVALEKAASKGEKAALAELAKGELSDGQVVERRRRIDPIRRTQARLIDRVEQLRDPAGTRWLAAEVLGDDEVGLSFKVVAIRSAALQGEPLLPVLRDEAPGLKRPDDWTAFLLAAQALGPAARELAPAVLPLVRHADATLREHAALALAKLAVPEAIAPLVEQLAREQGRTQVKLAAALEILTRQKLGASPSAWQSWFAAEGIRYTSGQAQLGGGEPAVQMQASGYFHGIPQDARSIVYVIDVSGSMVVSMTDPKYADAAQTQPIPAPPGEESRIEVSKRELIKALGELPPATRFGIVYFSNGADRWQDKLAEATPDRVKKAQKWVGELGAGGATNIHDAMENAFAIAGRGAGDRYYDASVDTIFLLTDGQPFLPNGRDNPARTLDLVRRLNPLKRVVVHTIGLGSGIDDRFLRRLAEENGGVFVQR